jgi:chorismate dehydratase
LNSPRVGCVKYLNARPLIHGWPGHVELDHPAALCRRLARGDVDLALVSSFEFLRNRTYRVVDGVSISSHGPVYSVVVAYQGDISEIDEIELDPAAETSVNLLRCLLTERGLKPRLSWHPRLGDGALATEHRRDTDATARLLIGDGAIRFRQTHPEFHYWDLGEQWKRIIDLPFVYALWLIRPEVGDANTIPDQLRSLRDQNLAKIDELIAQEKEFDLAFCRRYYRENLRFSFGNSEKHGLRKFADLCTKLDLIPKRALELELV